MLQNLNSNFKIMKFSLGGNQKGSKRDISRPVNLDT